MELYQSKYTGEEIDERLEKSGVVCGTYSGDNVATRFINLGFTPSAVIVAGLHGDFGYSSTYWGGVATKDSPSEDSAGGNPIIKIVENGFNVYYSTGAKIYTNANNASYSPYRYIAFR